jgi:hypothetical protein
MKEYKVIPESHDWVFSIFAYSLADAYWEAHKTLNFAMDGGLFDLEEIR